MQVSLAQILLLAALASAIPLPIHPMTDGHCVSSQLQSRQLQESGGGSTSSDMGSGSSGSIWSSLLSSLLQDGTSALSSAVSSGLSDLVKDIVKA